MFFRLVVICFFFFKQKTAYEMRISDWSSDVCSSDLLERSLVLRNERADRAVGADIAHADDAIERDTAAQIDRVFRLRIRRERVFGRIELAARIEIGLARRQADIGARRSEEHTSEIQVTNAHPVCRLLLANKQK